MYNKLEQFKLKFEKVIGIQKHAGKVRKVFFFKVKISELDPSATFELNDLEWSK